MVMNVASTSGTLRRTSTCLAPRPLQILFTSTLGPSWSPIERSSRTRTVRGLAFSSLNDSRLSDWSLPALSPTSWVLSFSMPMWWANAGPAIATIPKATSSLRTRNLLGSLEAAAIGVPRCSLTLWASGRHQVVKARVVEGDAAVGLAIHDVGVAHVELDLVGEVLPARVHRLVEGLVDADQPDHDLDVRFAQLLFGHAVERAVRRDRVIGGPAEREHRRVRARQLEIDLPPQLLALLGHFAAQHHHAAG